MSEFKGTPGPWEVEANTCYFSIESQGGGIGDVCMSGHVFDGGDCLGSTSKANAILIAAAPELLEALQACEKILSEIPLTVDLVEDLLFARSAIAKALGG